MPHDTGPSCGDTVQQFVQTHAKLKCPRIVDGSQGLGQSMVPGKNIPKPPHRRCLAKNRSPPPFWWFWEDRMLNVLSPKEKRRIQKKRKEKKKGNGKKG